MPYRITRRDAGLQAALRRIAAEQIDRALAEIADARLPRAECVHQVRKRAKKLRGLIRLVRPAFDAYSEENRAFRDAARPLSPLRDAEVFTETHDALMTTFADQLDRAAFASVRRRFTLRRKRVVAESDPAALLDAFGRSMRAARGRSRDWRLESDGFRALAPGLVRTYRRARKAMARARETRDAADLHDWRKRVKYHWYHARLLRDIWPEAMTAHRDAADALGGHLGDRHDLAAYRRAIEAAPDDFGRPADIEALLGLIDRRALALEDRAFALGARLLAEKPRALEARWQAWWAAWKAEEGRGPV